MKKNETYLFTMLNSETLAAISTFCINTLGAAFTVEPYGFSLSLTDCGEQAEINMEAIMEHAANNGLEVKAEKVQAYEDYSAESMAKEEKERYEERIAKLQKDNDAAKELRDLYLRDWVREREKVEKLKKQIGMVKTMLDMILPDEDKEG